MKRINREISIFNLSMMDVISGAMGAFLILVVILSRHYNSEFINTQRILDLQKQLVEATGSLSEVSELVSGDISNTDLIERSLQAAKSNVDRSKAYVKEIYDELQEANATIEQQTEQIAALESRLVRFKPFFIMTKWSCDEATDIDIYLGVGGAPEGVLAAAALACLGGQMQGRLVAFNAEDRAWAKLAGIGDLKRKYTLQDMVSGDLSFAATGITDGSLTAGVHHDKKTVTTSSVVMRASTRTRRWIKTEHADRRKFGA